MAGREATGSACHSKACTVDSAPLIGVAHSWRAWHTSPGCPQQQQHVSPVSRTWYACLCKRCFQPIAQHVAIAIAKPTARAKMQQECSGHACNGRSRSGGTVHRQLVNTLMAIQKQHPAKHEHFCFMAAWKQQVSSATHVTNTSLPHNCHSTCRDTCTSRTGTSGASSGKPRNGPPRSAGAPRALRLRLRLPCRLALLLRS